MKTLFKPVKKAVEEPSSLDLRILECYAKLWEHRKSIGVALVFTGGAAGLLKAYYTARSARSPTQSTTQTSRPSGEKSKDINKKWFTELLVLIFSKKRVVGTFITLCVLLVLKTMISVKIADMMGTGAELIVTRKFNESIIHITKFAFLSFPAAAINASIHTFQELLAINCREALTKQAQDMYLDDTRFYDIAYWGTNGYESCITDSHQRIVSDINIFSTELCQLFVMGFKPLIDIVIYCYKIKNSMGYKGLSLMWGYFVFLFLVKSLLSPAFGKLTKRASMLEGEYQSAHQRITHSAEEIAFFKGADKEKSILTEKLKVIIRHTRFTIANSFYMSVIDNLLGKYFATIVAYISMALPIMFPMFRLASKDSLTAEELSCEYTRNSQYLLNLSNGIKSIAILTTRINKTVGRFYRIAQLLENLDILRKTKKTACEPADEVKRMKKSISSNNLNFLEEWKAKCNEFDELADKKGTEPEDSDEEDEEGNSTKGNEDKTEGEESEEGTEEKEIKEKKKKKKKEQYYIKFVDVTIVAPDKRLLIKQLNMKLKKGVSTLITGPNGTGKSSLFRAIGGLWPIYSGKVIKSPSDEECDIFFLTQNPYFVLGNLRDQIIYPLSTVGALKRCGLPCRTPYETKKSIKELDYYLGKLMDIVDLKKNVTRNFDTRKDWSKELSGGQRQLLSMVRLAFHRPTFALLDECTSAVSADKDSLVFEVCQALEITMLSISHKPKYHRCYHEMELRLTGGGGYVLGEIPKEKKDY